MSTFGTKAYTQNQDITRWRTYKICRSEPDFCRVRFWNEERYVPKSISFTKNQYKTLRAEYTFNRAGDLQEMRYSCTVLPYKDQCFTN
jgi:hypothetical protein